MSAQKIAGLLAALMIGQPALAADLPSRTMTMPSPAVPLFTWTGFHLGVNAGYTTRRDRLDGTIPDLNAVLPGAGQLALQKSGGGFTGGGQLGYDYQFGANRGIVLGVEADLAYTDLDQTSALPVPPGLPLQATYKSRLDELGTIRGRLGYGFDRLLVYGTGGFAYGDASRTSTLVAGGATIARVAVDDFEVGYAAGGGLEYALPTMAMLATLPGTVTLRAEYLHYDLQQRSTPLSLFGQNTVVRMRNEGDLGRVGVNYKF